MTRRPATTRTRGLGCLWFAAALLLVALVAWFLRAPILTAAGAVLVENDGLHPADLAVTLSGEAYGTRVLKASEVARQGYAPAVLVSFVRTYGICNCEIEYAESKGYPASLFIPFPQTALSTRQETQQLDGYFHAHGVHSILLVTSNYHTRRAAYLMRRVDPSLKVWAIPAPDPYFTPSTWWQTREGQKTFFLEWTKTIAAHLGD